MISQPTRLPLQVCRREACHRSFLQFEVGRWALNVGRFSRNK